MTAENKILDWTSDKSESIKEATLKLYKIIKENLPEGFEEVVVEKFIHFAVPHKIYPAGYHCNPKEPLPFISLSVNKNYISIYHMGIYANKLLYDWFINEYSKLIKKKPDVGKSCIRFKDASQIPFDLIKELVSKITVQEWIETYTNAFKK